MFWQSLKREGRHKGNLRFPFEDDLGASPRRRRGRSEKCKMLLHFSRRPNHQWSGRRDSHTPARGARLRMLPSLTFGRSFLTYGLFLPSVGVRSLQIPPTDSFTQITWSGRRDSNPRPLRPERSALARLRYSPIYFI